MYRFQALLLFLSVYLNEFKNIVNHKFK